MQQFKVIFAHLAIYIKLAKLNLAIFGKYFSE